MAYNMTIVLFCFSIKYICILMGLLQISKSNSYSAPLQRNHDVLFIVFWGGEVYSLQFLAKSPFLQTDPRFIQKSPTQEFSRERIE